LSGGLKEKVLQNAKLQASKFLAFADSARIADWMAWYRKKIAFAKCTA
jgi:hypothetical protein